uniref:Uncharacterized protein n=1 Tax=Panagrolaimus superbus TaxID=310955 RepID=A0A914YL30_9BILA
MNLLFIFCAIFVVPTILAQFPPPAKFECGRNEAENAFAALSVTLNCQPRLAHFNNCCIAHDKCYDNQLGRIECDNAFCNCLQMAAVGQLFCKTLNSRICTCNSILCFEID